jgi:3,4-dihydroxy 2-butanone 4-phosphate synthase/GTP cyclohydrolase II
MTITSSTDPHACSTRVDEVIRKFADGEIVVITDDADREGEGDLVVAGDTVTSEQMAFIIRHTSGIVCAAMSGEVAESLDLAPMVQTNSERHSTAFTVTVDATIGTTTGISARDRARTLHVLANPSTTPDALSRPGHVFPLRARANGVLERRGHTEAAVDVAHLAGRRPVAAICELMQDDGTATTLAQAEQFAVDHGLAICSVTELAEHRIVTQSLGTRTPLMQRATSCSGGVRRVSQARIPRGRHQFEVITYQSDDGLQEHVAVVAGGPDLDDVLVRVHSECFTGEVLGSARCDCGPQLDAALDLIGDAGRGVVVYLRGHEGRGIGLSPKLDAYNLQDGGLDTVDANLELGYPVDARSYADAVAILADLGVSTARLLTNNPSKVAALALGGITLERVPLVLTPTDESGPYLEAKRRRLGHHLPPTMAIQPMHSAAACS